MRVVLDINILVSALVVQTGNPAPIYRAREEGYFHAADLHGASRRAAQGSLALISWTGDKGGLLALDRHKVTQIISASNFAALFA